MRRLRPDPIPLAAQARILDAAIRAPNPGNTQAWRFLLVDEPTLKQQLARLNQQSQTEALASYYAAEAAARGISLEEAERTAAGKLSSAMHLAEHFAGA